MHTLFKTWFKSTIAQRPHGQTTTRPHSTTAPQPLQQPPQPPRPPQPQQPPQHHSHHNNHHNKYHAWIQVAARLLPNKNTFASNTAVGTQKIGETHVKKLAEKYLASGTTWANYHFKEADRIWEYWKLHDRTDWANIALCGVLVRRTPAIQTKSRKPSAQ